MKEITYDEKFYQGQMDNSYRSAKIIMDHLFAHFRPTSVVDFGCGVGTWLTAAREANSGVGEYLGLDGDWGEKQKIFPSDIKFKAEDLSFPICLDRRFDLAISLEVAEHLPQDSAITFVESITNIADVILFGAAIPGQGGVEHINEQYQSYWYHIFNDLNYICLDAVRPYFFNDNRVGVAYRQNTFLYVKENESTKNLMRNFQIVNPRMLDVVHPIILERHTKRKVSMKYLMRQIIDFSVGK